MRVVETFTCSKAGASDGGEDIVFADHRFAAVIDGATLNRDYKKPARSEGRVAAEAVREAILCLEFDCDAPSAVRAMTFRVRRANAALGTSGAAAIVVYSAFRREIWSVGDCRFIAGDVICAPQFEIDRALGDLRAFVLESRLLSGATATQLSQHDPGREAIEPLLHLQSKFANLRAPSRFAYGVLNGRAVPPRFIRVHRIPVCVDEVVLASDGYPDPARTLAGSEAALGALLAVDPLCISSHVSTKGLCQGQISFDDRSYLRVAL